LLKLTLAAAASVIMLSSISTVFAVDLPHVGHIQITKPIIKMRLNQTCDGGKYTCLLPPGSVDCYVNLVEKDNMTKTCKIGDVD